MEPLFALILFFTTNVGREETFVLDYNLTITDCNSRLREVNQRAIHRGTITCDLQAGIWTVPAPIPEGTASIILSKGPKQYFNDMCSTPLGIC